VIFDVHKNIGHITVIIRRISAKFDMLASMPWVIHQMVLFLEIQDGGCQHLEKTQKDVSWSIMDPTL